MPVRESLTAVLLCANDPVAAWGGARILREVHGIEPAVVTGPATDNAVGVEQIESRLGLAGINALSNAIELGDHVAVAIGAGEKTGDRAGGKTE